MTTESVHAGGDTGAILSDVGSAAGVAGLLSATVAGNGELKLWVLCNADARDGWIPCYGWNVFVFVSPAYVCR